MIKILLLKVISINIVWIRIIEKYQAQSNILDVVSPNSVTVFKMTCGIGVIDQDF